MPEGLEKIGLAVGLIIFIAFVFFWLLPVELPPILSEMSGSEIISPIFSYVVSILFIITGILLIIVVIFSFFKKRVI